MSDADLMGGCDCGRVRFRLKQAPLYVHCCLCLWCQRETGSAFALNALIETDQIELTGAQPVLVPVPSGSGKGQQIARCPDCQVAVWSHYAGKGQLMAFVKVGTLDQPNQAPPDIHIYTASKQDWVVISEDLPSSEAYYDVHHLWPESSLVRLEQLTRGVG